MTAAQLKFGAGLFLAMQLLVGCTSQGHLAPPVAEVAPQLRDCPAELAAGTRCLGGQDSAGAFYLIAIPKDWAGVLVLHAHGGPELGAPKAERVSEDLKRWSIMVKAGYAWAGSSFAQGGVAVSAAAADTERLRQIFVAHVAKPKVTILHGQSWGAGVAAKAAERYAAPGSLAPAYDGVLLSNGVLGGGTRSYDFRLDLRVVYQYLCANHPRPEEAQYPLWMGLPEGAKLTRADLAARAESCLGLATPAPKRTPEQQARLQTILNVIHIPERSLLGHLNWATWHFQDVVLKRSAGSSPWGNIGVKYSGSPDDAAMNAGVLRYAADPRAVAKFGADSDPNGRVGVPMLTVHGIHDPIAFVELESQFRAAVAAAGQGKRLVQTFSDDADHSYLSDPVYPALMAELLAWVGQGHKPSPASVAQRCKVMEAQFGPGCRLVADYSPAELETRVAPRQRP
jgi:alpha-beta hydrolase superfamily lysophospholipase